MTVIKVRPNKQYLQRLIKRLDDFHTVDELESLLKEVKKCPTKYIPFLTEAIKLKITQIKTEE